MKPVIYQHERLEHGPLLAVANLPDSECVALNITIPAGSRDETHVPEGMAHFLEHMVFKGTARRSARELSLAIENAGGQINACTSEDQTVYEGRGEAELLPLLIDVIGDMVWHAGFPEAEIEVEREVIGEEITMYRESPSDHIGDMISAALWAGHPLGHAISGSHESIARINRETLRSFRDRHHFHEDVVIAVAGPFDLETVRRELLPHLPGRVTPAQPIQKFYPNGKGRHVTEKRDTEQLQLALAWHTCGRHDEDRHALRLLSMILGESATSRLFIELREERGLCYQISSDVTLFDDTGAFEISAGLDPQGRDEALACIHRELHGLAKHGPQTGELERAKRLMIAQSKLGFETTSAHAAWAGECLMDFGRIPLPIEWRERIAQVTDADVQGIADQLIHQSPAMAEIS